MFAVIIFFFISFSSFGQLTKGSWLVGGRGSILSSKEIITAPNLRLTTDQLQVNVSAHIGYFIADRFAIGLGQSFAKYKSVVENGGNSNENRIEVGPFARFYLLQMDKQYNLLVDIDYQYGLYWFTPTKGNINTFSAAAGPVIFFNSSVGLEFLVGYYSRTEVKRQNGDFHYQQRGIQTRIGLIIHLEK